MSYAHTNDIIISCQEDKASIAKEFCDSILEKYKGKEPFQAEDGNYHYIYLTINIKNNKFYVGKHTTDSLKDGYIGSGHHLVKAINKYGKDSFTHYRLCFFSNSEDAYKEEALIVDYGYIERYRNRLQITYNLRTGGFDGNTPSEETRKKMSESQRENTSYDLIKEDMIRENVKREGLLPLLKKDYKFISPNQLYFYHNLVNLKEIGQTKGYVGVSKKRSKENFQKDVIEFLENGFNIGTPPQNHNPEWDEDVVNKVKSFLKERQDRGRERISKSIRANTTYSLIKEERQEVSRFNVLRLLKEGYQFTTKKVMLCNKAGKVKTHFFDFKGSNAQTRGKQHLKLIALLESGEWQIGYVWEGEPKREEPKGALQDNNLVVGDYCNKRRMYSLF